MERTGLHEREFIDTLRYSLTQPCTVEMDDSVHVMNLVDGSHVLIESTDDSFAPFELHYAETAIVPADVKRYRIVPRGRRSCWWWLLCGGRDTTRQRHSSAFVRVRNPGYRSALANGQI